MSKKFPNLLLYLLFAFLYMQGIYSVFSQSTVQPSISATATINNSSVTALSGSNENIYVCNGEAILFQAYGDTSGTLNYNFKKNGVSLGGSQPTVATLNTVNFVDEDEFSVTVTNFSTAGAPAVGTTSHIKVNVLPVPNAALSSSVGPVICSSDGVTTFTASGGGQYEFFLNGISLTTVSTIDNHSLNNSTLSSGDVISVSVFAADSNGNVLSQCSDSESLKITVYNNNAGSITGGQSIFTGTTPNPIMNQVDGTFNGISASPVSGYFWEEATNANGPWTATTGHAKDYSPSSLSTTTFFRRGISQSTASSSAKCYYYTPVVRVTTTAVVSPSISHQTQTVCSGALPTELTLGNYNTTANTTYKWEYSVQGSSFSTVSGSGASTNVLRFSSTTPYTPTQSTIYRLIIGSSLDPTLELISNEADINIIVNTSSLVSSPTGGVFCDGIIPTFIATSIPSADYRFSVNGIEVQSFSTNNSYSPSTNFSSNATITLVM